MRQHEPAKGHEAGLQQMVPEQLYQAQLRIHRQVAEAGFTKAWCHAGGLPLTEGALLYSNA